MMFGDSEYELDVARSVLELFSLSEILELNDITEEEVLALLIGRGHVTQPEGLLYEGLSEVEEGT